MFNLDPKPTAPRHWLDDTWLNSSSRPIQNFGEFDWDQVPKMDYTKALFRQLATPESAKVFDDAQDFVLETFGKLPKIAVTSDEEIVIDAKLVEALATLDLGERARKLERVSEAYMADQGLIPLFHPIGDFASRKGLLVEPRPQRRFNALMIRPQ